MKILKFKVTGQLFNDIIFCIGAFSMYEVNWRRSLCRILYQISALCFVITMYFTTVYLNIQHGVGVVDANSKKTNLNPKHHSMDFTKISTSLLLLFNFVYLCVRISYGITRFHSKDFKEITMALENITMEINYRKLKLGMRPKKFEPRDTGRVIFYLCLWLFAWAVDYCNAAQSPLQFAFGFTFIVNFGPFVCVLVDHIFICCLNLMVIHFQNIEEMLRLVSGKDLYSKRYENCALHDMKVDIVLKNIKAISNLHR